MIEYGTWIAVLILGPGALGIFIWFLFDLFKIMKRDTLSSQDKRPK